MQLLYLTMCQSTFAHYSNKSIYVICPCGIVLVTLGLLVKFGELSGLSQSHNWDDTDLQDLPSLPTSEADIGGDTETKADWIWEMVGTVL